MRTGEAPLQTQGTSPVPYRSRLAPYEAQRSRMIFV